MAPSKLPSAPPQGASKNTTTPQGKQSKPVAAPATENQPLQRPVIYDLDQLPAWVTVDDIKPKIRSASTTVTQKQEAVVHPTPSGDPVSPLVKAATEASKKDESDASKKDETDASKKDEPDTSKKHDSDASKKHDSPKSTQKKQAQSPCSTSNDCQPPVRAALAKPADFGQFRNPRPHRVSNHGYRQLARAAAAAVAHQVAKPTRPSTPVQKQQSHQTAHSTSAADHQCTPSKAAVGTTAYKRVPVKRKSRVQLQPEPQPQPKPKPEPKMLACVHCGQEYDPDTVDFGSC